MAYKQIGFSTFSGPLADRPALTDESIGTTYYATDTDRTYTFKGTILGWEDTTTLVAPTSTPVTVNSLAKFADISGRSTASTLVEEEDGSLSLPAGSTIKIGGATVVTAPKQGDLGTTDPEPTTPNAGDWWEATEDGNYTNLDPPAGGLTGVTKGDMLMWDGTEWVVQAAAVSSVRSEGTATAGQNTFTGANNIDSDSDVYINGSLLLSNKYTIATTTITLATPLSLNDEWIVKTTQAVTIS